MQKKTFFFAAAVVCLLAAGWGYYQYQKPRASAAGAAPAFRLTAEQLYTEYSSNEADADKKYGGQVVEVTGLVKDVQTTATATNILLDGGTTGGVNCSFENGTTATIATGKQLTVKGRCTGFLMDVNLVDAVLIDK